MEHHRLTHRERNNEELQDLILQDSSSSYFIRAPGKLEEEKKVSTNHGEKPVSKSASTDTVLSMVFVLDRSHIKITCDKPPTLFPPHDNDNGGPQR